MANKIIITDEIVADYLDPQNTKSLNEIISKKYENEIVEIKKSNPILERETPIKLAAISAGITANSIVKDFTAQGVGEWLLPAYIDERLREDIGQNNLLQYLCNTVTTTNSLSVMAAKLNIIDDKDNKDATRMKRVSEGADIPIAELKLGESAISLFKYARAVQATYEAMAFMKVDLFSKALSLIASDVSGQQAERAIEVLVKGDGNKNAIDTINTASSDTVTNDDLLELMMEFQDRINLPITTIVTGREFFKQLAKIYYPTDEAVGASGSFTLNFPQLINQNVRVVYSKSVPQISSKKALIALNTDMALVKYTAPSMNIREMSKNIRNQTQLGTISEISGFAKFNDKACLAMISK